MYYHAISVVLKCLTWDFGQPTLATRTDLSPGGSTPPAGSEPALHAGALSACPTESSNLNMATESGSQDILTFDQAVAASADFAGKPHVLLGNGFSIACRPECFTYDALLDEATFPQASLDVREVFGLLGTSDFEKVIEVLRLAAGLADVYATTDPALAARLRADAEVVREALAQVLASRHPDKPFDIEESEFLRARQFLSNFERIYTLNYDMLLYWTIMQDLEPEVSRNDGFTNPDDENADYVVWEPYVNYGNQRIFFLHGSLHLYDNGAELAKITWSRTAIPLVDQIRESLAEARYPLIVTEGTSSEKTEKILHHAYLTHAIRSFSGIGGSLFTYGLSLAPNDEHLLRRIAEGKVKALFVGVYGDPNTQQNADFIQRALALADERAAANARTPLSVQFFDAESAHVWR